jgi:hypothetical protein
MAMRKRGSLQAPSIEDDLLCSYRSFYVRRRTKKDTAEPRTQHVRGAQISAIGEFLLFVELTDVMATIWAKHFGLRNPDFILDSILPVGDKT